MHTYYEHWIALSLWRHKMSTHGHTSLQITCWSVTYTCAPTARTKWPTNCALRVTAVTHFHYRYCLRRHTTFHQKSTLKAKTDVVNCCCCNQKSNHIQAQSPQTRSKHTDNGQTYIMAVGRCKWTIKTFMAEPLPRRYIIFIQWWITATSTSISVIC